MPRKSPRKNSNLRRVVEKSYHKSSKPNLVSCASGQAAAKNYYFYCNVTAIIMQLGVTI